MLLMVLQSPFKGSSSSHKNFPPLQESVGLWYLPAGHGRDVLAILMCTSMPIKSEDNICYVCVYEYVRLIYVTVYFFCEILRTSRYVGSAFLSKRPRSFFNKKALLKARWLRSPSKQVMDFWNQLDWWLQTSIWRTEMFHDKIHRNYNKIQCTLIFSRCKLNNILCKKIEKKVPAWHQLLSFPTGDGRNLMGIFEWNLQPFVQRSAPWSFHLGCDWPCVLDTLDESRVSWGLCWVPPWVGWKGGKWSPNDYILYEHFCGIFRDGWNVWGKYINHTNHPRSEETCFAFRSAEGLVYLFRLSSNFTIRLD